eukprot:g2061.t1
MATEAVRLDQAQTNDAQALQFYIDACTELLEVIKAETDTLRKAGLTKRMNTYMVRAEQLKKRMRRKEWLRDKAAMEQRQRNIYWGNETLGSKLLTKTSGERPTMEVLAGSCLVGLFFGAKWSTKSCEFSEVLSKFYNVHHAKSPHDITIVYISADQDQQSYDENYGTMPWVGLPYSNRRQKGLLGAKYRVESSELPKLVILDGKTGAIISGCGVDAIRGSGAAESLKTWLSRSSQPPQPTAPGAGTIPPQPGAGTRPSEPQFPPATTIPASAPSSVHVVGEPVDIEKNGVVDELAPGSDFQLLLKSGNRESARTVLSNKNLVGLYYSAHWCPPCRAFTPKLVDFYNTGAASTGFEVVFVSGDRDEAAFKEYHSSMPWPAIAFDNEKTKQAIVKKFELQSLPVLIILDGKTGRLITKDGRADVMNLNQEALAKWRT